MAHSHKKKLFTDNKANERPFEKYRKDTRSKKKAMEEEEDKPYVSKGRKPFVAPDERKDDAKKTGYKEHNKKDFKAKDNNFSEKNAASYDNSGRNNSGRTAAPGKRDSKAAVAPPPARKDKYEQERVFFKAENYEEREPEKILNLNTYIAHCGVCSRRDAAELIKEGRVSVNGTKVETPGYRVQKNDAVFLDGKLLKLQKGLVYILLNKPKGYITTTEDDAGRRTVMELVDNADVGRLYPVGRLDRATTGLLLLTNDGDLAQKLSHPRNQVKKIYKVSLNKALALEDYDKIKEGLTLEDGLIKVDEIAFLDSKEEVGVEIHSGKNRIVRRIFEALGYSVEKLDRVMYAGLTKKNLPRGKWRFLLEKEIIFLKHFKS